MSAASLLVTWKADLGDPRALETRGSERLWSRCCSIRKLSETVESGGKSVLSRLRGAPAISDSH